MVNTPLLYVSLSDLTPQQMDTVLVRFNLTSDGELKDKIRVLTYSCTFMELFAEANPGEIKAGFRRGAAGNLGKFIELKWIKSKDEIITLFGDSAVGHQCNICFKTVGKKDKALTCSGCDMYFHTTCCKVKISSALYDALQTSPSFVKTYCDKCEIVITNVNQRLINLEHMVGELKVIAQTKPLMNETSNRNVPLTYPTATNSSKSRVTKQEVSAEDRARKDLRTRVVIRPLDVTIVSSYDIKKEINRRYNDVALESCFATAGGSFVLECEDEENAYKLDADWDLSLFGKNSGLKSFDSVNYVAVVKKVIMSNGSTEEDLRGELRKVLPLKKDSDVELFKRRNRMSKKDEFTGTVKITFSDRKSLEEAVKEKVKMNNGSYNVEEWIPKPKIRFCYRCQMIGHVAHRCRNKKTLCGKCGSHDHGTRDCTVTDPNRYKCAHCGQAHITGTNKCLKFKECKEDAERRTQRQHNGC